MEAVFYCTVTIPTAICLIVALQIHTHARAHIRTHTHMYICVAERIRQPILNPRTQSEWVPFPVRPHLIIVLQIIHLGTAESVQILSKTAAPNLPPSGAGEYGSQYCNVM